MAITVCPVTPSFAAEIGDVDLSKPIEPSDLTAIKDAFAKYAVLIFPEQHLSADQHLDFARLFGPLETTIALFRKDAQLRVSARSLPTFPTSTPITRSGARKAGSACSSWATGFGTPTARSSGCRRGPRCSTRARSRRSAATPNSLTSAPPMTRCPTLSSAGSPPGRRAFDFQFARAARLYQFQRGGAPGNAAGAAGHRSHDSGIRAQIALSRLPRRPHFRHARTRRAAR